MTTELYTNGLYFIAYFIVYFWNTNSLIYYGLGYNKKKSAVQEKYAVWKALILFI